MNLEQIINIKRMQVIEQDRCRRSILEICTIDQILAEPHLKEAMGW